MTRFRQGLWFVLIVCSFSPLAVHAGQVLEVSQVGRAFSVGQITLQHGDTLRFVNADKFLHQVSVSGPGTHVVSDEQEPGKSLDVQFDKRGLFTVRCEIHPKMLLTVAVQ